MTENDAPNDSRQAFTAPRAAAIAGVVFSGLLIIGLALLLLSVPADPSQPGTWMRDPGRRDTVRLALNLFPFAGIAFLWFMGVLRNRLGRREDQFLATVFLCSGILFVVSMFSAAAIAGGLLEAVADGHLQPESDVCYFGRRAVYTLLTVFAFKMAGVFMLSTGTIGLRTKFLPRWVAIVGYVCALVLLLVITSWGWIGLVFPFWVLLVSAVVLVGEFRGQSPVPERKPLTQETGQAREPDPVTAGQR
jgi:MFS family permease